MRRNGRMERGGVGGQAARRAGGGRGAAVEPGLIALGVAMFLWSGCGPPPAPAGETRPAPVPRPTAGLDPAVTGSLRQDQISVRMAAGPVRIEVTPLAEWVLEAAAPDTRDRLRRIARTHGPELVRTSGAPAPALFLVSFTSREPGAKFQPDDLHLLSRGLRERPVAIRAITPGWGSQRLAQQSSAMAVYAFGDGLDLTRELTVAYQGVEDSSWSAKLTVIEAERARIGRGTGTASRRRWTVEPTIPVHSPPGRSSSRP